MQPFLTDSQTSEGKTRESVRFAPLYYYYFIFCRALHGSRKPCSQSRLVRPSALSVVAADRHHDLSITGRARTSSCHAMAEQVSPSTPSHHLTPPHLQNTPSQLEAVNIRRNLGLRQPVEQASEKQVGDLLTQSSADIRSLAMHIPTTERRSERRRTGGVPRTG